MALRLRVRSCTSRTFRQRGREMRPQIADYRVDRLLRHTRRDYAVFEHGQAEHEIRDFHGAEKDRRASVEFRQDEPAIDQFLEELADALVALPVAQLELGRRLRADDELAGRPGGVEVVRSAAYGGGD